MTAADEHAAAPTVAAAPALVRQQRPPPIRSLDGLRAVAVLIVLVSHAGYGEVVPGGLGVTIFFFLSGYLITTLLLDEHGSNGRIHIGHFYLRRAFRLLPPLFVLLAIAYGLVALGWLGGGFSWDGLTSQVFYYANYFQILSDDTQAIADRHGHPLVAGGGGALLHPLPGADVRAAARHLVASHDRAAVRRPVRARAALADLAGVASGLRRDPHVLRDGHPVRLDPVRVHPRARCATRPACPRGPIRSARGCGRSDWALLGGRPGAARGDGRVPGARLPGDVPVLAAGHRPAPHLLLRRSGSRRRGRSRC